jgi:glycosyltransferase involved in cell wall biosynthesis
VPCHHELYRDGVNGLFYPLEPQSLADAASRLIKDIDLADRIAQGAWAQSAAYDYPHRAKTMLKILEAANGNPQRNNHT